MSDDCSTDIDRLELPASLERIGRGIRVAGHRVSLFQILDELRDGKPPERLREMFPTISDCKLNEIISFCKRHDDVMQKYHAETQAAFAAGAGSRIGEAPSLAELRRRKSERAK